jgi:hypothetical protein
VKKKMRRRTLMKLKKVPHEMRSNPNCNKKLPMTTPKKSKTFVTKLSCDTGKNTTTKTATKNNVNQTKKGNSLSLDATMLSVAVLMSYNQSVRSSPTKQESAIHCTKSLNLETTNHVSNHGMNVVHGVNALLNDETALFEDSADFWDGFLLETYRQITSNNPDSYDFEPIPYDVLARGAPVEVETDSYPKHLSDSVDSSQASMMMDNAAAKPTPSKVDVKAIAQNAQDQPDQRGIWHAKDYDVRVKKTNLDVTYDEMCSKDPTKFVGPNTWQMDVIHRMIFFLDRGSQEQYSLYSQHFRTITQECTTHHMNGSLKHRHLPGAIFEQLVDAIGGSTFLSIYKEAKQLSFGHLQSGHAVIVDEAVPIEPPSLIQIAVGYGYSLAMANSGNGPKVSGDVTQNESESVLRATEIGAQALIEMSSESRLSFWNDRIMKHDDMSD